MKRILVTGGAGFIGSHIVDQIIARGDEAIVLDDFSSGSNENTPNGIDVIQADIASPQTIEMIHSLKPDAIVHAAAQASVPRSMADPVRDRAVNLLGTEHVIEGARRAGGCRLVFLSTGGGIYGETATPASEEALPRPKSFYSVHKYAAERYVELSGLPYGIARLANIYGPRQRSHLEGGVVAIFADRLAQDLPITIYGNGEQRRDLVHVSDTADAVLTMIDAQENGVWNVGTGQATSINELLTLMGTIIRPAVDIRHEPTRAGDVFSSILSAEKIAEELGWEATTPLAAGISTILTSI